MSLSLLVIFACQLTSTNTPSQELPAQDNQATATETPTAVLIDTAESQGITAVPTNQAVTPQVQANNNDINPLTGLPVDNPELLERCPLIIKVQNVPRESRPQWGLSLADHVYEYYIEYGDTRFTAVFYGQDSEMVGPVRSARHIDIQLVNMYEGIFAFGGAYDDLMKLIMESDFSNRLIREGPYTHPGLYRYEPKVHNYLIADTGALQDIIAKYEMDNSRQSLAGMFFDPGIPGNGVEVPQIFVRFSGGMYNRWDYDSENHVYMRYSDAQDDVNRNKPVYELLTDRLTGDPITANNLVILLAEYKRIEEVAEVYNVALTGEGQAYVARDGNIYPVIWKHYKEDDLLLIYKEDGTLFPMKPGNTWFEVMDIYTKVEQDEESWRFSFIPPVWDSSTENE